MENDIIRVLLYALVIFVAGSANLYVLARGLPQFPLAYNAFWGAVFEIIPRLRRIFDPDTAASKALKAKGVDPLIADMLAEMAADKLESMAKPFIIVQPEEADPLAE